MANPSLRTRLIWYIGGAGLLFVGMYTLLMINNFLLGAESSMKHQLALEARVFAEHYRDDPQAVMPSGTYLHSYLGSDALPPVILALFPRDEHQHQDLNVDGGPVEQSAEWQSHPEAQRQFCGDKACFVTFFYSYRLHDGQWLYLVMVLDEETFNIALEGGFSRMFAITLPIAAACLLVVLLLAWLLVRKISQPIGQLSHWADSLTLADLDKPLPDHRYRELDLVAERLFSAFERIARVLENEHKFLRNASHELRTPIAVMSTTLEVLDKLAARAPRGAAEDKAIARLNRAVKTMGQLTETLLWLGRDTDNLPAAETVALDQLLASLVEDNRYLLSHKVVEVQLHVSPVTLTIQRVPCAIVLANLIRNAFQYTHEGVVEIALTATELRISNCCRNQQSVRSTGSEYGFGLGLALVEQLTDRLGWHYRHQLLPGGRASVIRLVPAQPADESAD